MIDSKFALFCMGCAFSGSGYSAAFEQSNQSIQSFFEKNHYAEISLAWVRPDISGQVQHTEQLQQLGITDFSTGQLASTQFISNVALKLSAVFLISSSLNVGLTINIISYLFIFYTSLWSLASLKKQGVNSLLA